jgi:hypothetical protein
MQMENFHFRTDFSDIEEATAEPPPKRQTPFYHEGPARSKKNLPQRAQRGKAATKKEKADLTTKSTKFMSKNIRTLRGLRDLRGENIFRHVLHP